MKLVDHFTAFLKDTVNLNATRLEQLETSVEALKDVIREADWDAPLITFEPQGSWAHRTIIKPVEDKVFDADLLVIVEAVEGWDACEYLSTPVSYTHLAVPVRIICKLRVALGLHAREGRHRPLPVDGMGLDLGGNPGSGPCPGPHDAGG